MNNTLFNTPGLPCQSRNHAVPLYIAVKNVVSLAGEGHLASIHYAYDHNWPAKSLTNHQFDFPPKRKAAVLQIKEQPSSVSL